MLIPETPALEGRNSDSQEPYGQQTTIQNSKLECQWETQSKNACWSALKEDTQYPPLTSMCARIPEHTHIIYTLQTTHTHTHTSKPWFCFMNSLSWDLLEIRCFFTLIDGGSTTNSFSLLRNGSLLGMFHRELVIWKIVFWYFTRRLPCLYAIHNSFSSSPPLKLLNWGRWQLWHLLGAGRC